MYIHREYVHTQIHSHTHTGEQLNTELLQVYPRTCTQTKPWISSKAWAIQCNKKGLLTAKHLTNGRLCPESAITPRNWGFGWSVHYEQMAWNLLGKDGIQHSQEASSPLKPYMFHPQSRWKCSVFPYFKSYFVVVVVVFLRIQFLKTIVSSQHFQSNSPLRATSKRITLFITDLVLVYRPAKIEKPNQRPLQCAIPDAH